MDDYENDDVYCEHCDVLLDGDNLSDVTDEYGNPLCVGCTTECRGCHQTVGLIEMEPLFDYDGQDYCPDCHQRYNSCIQSARASYEEEIIEYGQQKFDDGVWS